MKRTDLELRELFTTLQGEFWERRLSRSSARLCSLDLSNTGVHKILALIGMRRVGKSTVQLRAIQELVNTNRAVQNQILFLNFEDDRVLPMDGKELGRLVDLFYASHPENHGRLTYLFFDEIQNVDGWATPVRRLFDTKECKIVLTGSSAKLLSREINTALRGRSLSQEIFPLSFQEWLAFRDQASLWGKALSSPKSRDILRQELSQFLEQGGFPETVGLNDSLRAAILQDYVNVLILKDVIERHQVSNETAIRYLLRHLLSQCAQTMSVHRTFNDLKSQGIKVAKDSVHKYLNYFEDAFVVFTIPLFTSSLRKQQTNPKKIYAIDNGLVRAMAPIILHRPGQNVGRLFENQVFIDLKRHGYTMHYYLTQSGHEIDFIAQRLNQPHRAFQVSVDAQAEHDPKERQAKDELSAELGLTVEYVQPGSYRAFLESLV